MRVIICTTLLIVGMSSSTSNAGLWQPDFASAMRVAQSQKRPLLLHFWAPWCGPCRQMERDVLHNPLVTNKIAGDVVGVLINADRNRALIRRFGVLGLPADVLVDATENRVLYRNEGYQDARSYAVSITRAASTHRPARSSQLETEPSTNHSEREEPVAGQHKAPDQESQFVGLRGRCPVSIVRDHRWRRGESRFQAEYKGVTYHMQSVAALQEFQRHPWKYAPRMMGCDPVALTRTHRAIPGDIRFGVFFHDELYLFTSDENRSAFKKSPERFLRVQQALHFKDIERGRYSHIERVRVSVQKREVH